MTKGNPTAREFNDPGVSGVLVPVRTEDGSVMHVREDMGVREALAFGQAALDAKDARIPTVTVGRKRFPTYGSSPVIERERRATMAHIAAEVEVALRGNKTADVKPVGTRVEVTKTIAEKYPVHYRFRRLWRPFRDTLVRALDRFKAWLRSL